MGNILVRMSFACLAFENTREAEVSYASLRESRNELIFLVLIFAV
jgi:hypothetical protein